MTKRQFYHLAFTLFLFGIAIGFNYYTRVAPQTKNYAAKINKYLHHLEKDVDRVFDNQDFIKRQLKDAIGLEEGFNENDFQFLEKLVEQDFTITVFQKDSLIFWTNNLALPNSSELSKASSERISRFINLKNGKLRANSTTLSG